jgi:hypothetical protein
MTNPSFDSCGRITKNPTYLFRQKTITLIDNINVVSARGKEIGASSTQLCALLYERQVTCGIENTTKYEEVKLETWSLNNVFLKEQSTNLIPF